MTKDEYAYATRFRDVLSRIASERINALRPPEALATVVSVAGSTAQIIFAGEATSVPVHLGAFIPSPGAMVLVGGASDRRYIVDIASGSFVFAAGAI